MSAGDGIYAPEVEAVVGQLAFPPGYLGRITGGAPLRNLSIVTVKGVSMSPTLNPGDVVMIDSTKRNLGFDGLFVLRYGDVLHVKRIGRSPRRGHVTVISDNPDQGNHEAPIEEIDVIGKVLWYGRKE